MSTPSRIFLAPGKVVLLGEYAVLDGAPSIVAAINRGVRCTVSQYTRQQDSMTIQSPAGDEYVLPALRAADAPPAWYSFDTWNPISTSSKVGLGHSAAAVVVALLAGRSLRRTRTQKTELFGTAFTVHNKIQGSGSGIDVAASVHGGVIRFQNRAVAPQPKVSPVVIFSGESADTGSRVEVYQTWRGRNKFVTQSAAIVDAFATDPIAALEEARILLEEMSKKAGIPYQTPALDRIAEIAREHRGAAKPSGAGGGDCAVALFPDKGSERAFIKAVKAAGFTVVPVALAEGAHEESA